MWSLANAYVCLYSYFKISLYQLADCSCGPTSLVMFEIEENTLNLSWILKNILLLHLFFFFASLYFKNQDRKKNCWKSSISTLKVAKQLACFCFNNPDSWTTRLLVKKVCWLFKWRRWIWFCFWDYNIKN